MSKEAHDVGSSRSDDCRFNNCVRCENPTQCGKCGWNPRVFQERKTALRAEWRRQEMIKEAKAK